MGRAHDLVVLPALAVAVLPTAILVGGDAVAVGEVDDVVWEEGQAVEEMASRCRSFIGGFGVQLGLAVYNSGLALDVVVQEAPPRAV